MKLLGRKGFTLVEVMIVVAIIALLAAIAIPNLLRARHNANEGAAIGACKTISTACESFRAAQTPPSYPANLAAMINPADGGPDYIDNTLAGAVAAGTPRQGYWYAYIPVGVAPFQRFGCTASPANPGITGSRLFWVDETGVVRINNAAGLPVE